MGMIDQIIDFNKTSGTTRMVEKVPSLNVEEETGTFKLFDYLEKQ